MRSLLILLFLTACALPKSAVVVPPKADNTIQTYEKRETSTLFQSTGVVKYFLPDLPSWANFVSSTGCRRNRSIRYLDYQNLRSSFGFKYADVAQFQALYNDEYRKQLFEKKLDVLPLKDEEVLFYRVSEKIQGGVGFFNPPKFKKVSLIWIDPLLTKENLKSALNEMVRNKKVQEGHPVFISYCLGTVEMEELLKSYMLEDQNIRLISSEFFSVFDLENRQLPHFYLDIGPFFESGQELILFTPLSVPLEIGGPFIESKI